MPNVMSDSEAEKAIQLTALRQKVIIATAIHTTVDTKPIKIKHIA